MDSCTSQADNVFGPVVAACRSGFDFTLLFEQAIFSALPSALVILASVGRIGHLSRESVKTISGQSWSSRAVVKLVGQHLSHPSPRPSRLLTSPFVDANFSFQRCATLFGCAVGITSKLSNQAVIAILDSVIMRRLDTRSAFIPAS
jgi:hypothetical protein